MEYLVVGIVILTGTMVYLYTEDKKIHEGKIPFK